MRSKGHLKTSLLDEKRVEEIELKKKDDKEKENRKKEKKTINIYMFTDEHLKVLSIRKMPQNLKCKGFFFTLNLSSNFRFLLEASKGLSLLCIHYNCLYLYIK